MGKVRPSGRMKKPPRLAQRDGYKGQLQVTSAVRERDLIGAVGMSEKAAAPDEVTRRLGGSTISIQGQVSATRGIDLRSQ